MKRLAALPFLFLAVAARAALISGSDTAGPAMAAELRAQVGADFQSDFRGTYDGERDLRAGRAAVALIFLRDGQKLPEIEAGKWVAAPVAYQPLYIAVHVANHADEIDLATLAGLYGESTDLRYDSWECLPASALTQTPFLVAPSPGKGLTVSHFREEVLDGRTFRKTVRFTDGDDSAEARAVSSPNCIVLLSRPPHTGNLKVLSVADGRPGRSNRPYAPTASNLHSGDYPLRVTLYAVWPKAEKAAAKTLAKAVLSEGVANVLTAKGLAPAPQNIRKKFEQSLDS